ncbi:hypothetical protein ACFYW8_41535 [Streptomyces sp. NPDC002742]|uniref:hypothetical protein n=1 Tax=Streptomyces sp. NPDC002742 TaxID=3364663 RepID=UPI0036CD23EC
MLVDRGERFRVVFDAASTWWTVNDFAFRRRSAGRRDAAQRPADCCHRQAESLASRVRDCSTGHAVFATGPLRGPIGSISRARSPIVNWGCQLFGRTAQLGNDVFVAWLTDGPDLVELLGHGHYPSAVWDKELLP